MFSGADTFRMLGELLGKKMDNAEEGGSMHIADLSNGNPGAVVL